MRRASALISLMLLACGGHEGNAPDTDADSSTGASTGSTTGEASTTAASSATAVSSTTAEDPSSTSDSSGGGGVCVDPTEPGGIAVLVTIRNDREAPIYLQHQSLSACARIPPFELYPGITMHLNQGEFCTYACPNVVASGQCGCSLGCGLVDQVVRLNPGATHSAGWSGTPYRGFTLDESCTAVEECRLCSARVPAPERLYNVVVRVSDAVAECETCDCEPGKDSCVLTGVQAGVVSSVMASLDYPPQMTVEVVVP